VKGFADDILPGADFPSIDAAQAEGFQMSNRRTGTRLRKPAIPAQVGAVPGTEIRRRDRFLDLARLGVNS
jgi:hypothetical protein